MPPPGYDAKGDAVLTFAGKASGGKRGKPERDRNAPKRNMSAYLLYQNMWCFKTFHFQSDEDGRTILLKTFIVNDFVRLRVF